jgi:hypothetical protein
VTIPGIFALSSTPTATLNYVAGNSGAFIYSLASKIDFDFINGATVTIGGGTLFTGSVNVSSTALSSIDFSQSSFKNGINVVPLNALSFTLGDIVGRGTGTFGITASTLAPTTTAVPEPFTIVGTILGGTAALRMRKKLAKAAQN